MNAVTSRELAHHLSAWLDRVEAGEELTIRRNGKPKARLVQVPKVELSPAERQERASTLMAKFDAISQKMKQPLLKPGEKFDRNEAYERY